MEILKKTRVLSKFPFLDSLKKAVFTKVHVVGRMPKFG
eukprot:UN19131